MTSTWRGRALRLAPGATVGPVIVLASLPALVLTYGLKDDYTYLAAAHGYRYAGVGEPASSVRLGRPLFGLLTRGLFGILPGVGWLWIPRALSIAGMTFFGLVLFRALTRLVRPPMVAALISLLVCSMPPFLVYTGWATLFCAPYSAALGGIAALIAGDLADAPVGERVRKAILGIVLLLVALAMYQPAAMAFWLVALILALARRDSAESLQRLLRSVALVGVPTMFGAYLMLKIGVWTLGAADAQRAGLLSDIPAKVRWIPQPLGLALNLFNMPQSAAFGAVIAALVIAGTLLFCRDCKGRARALILGFAVLTVPLSFAPNLLSQENYATFRTVGPLTATFALLSALLFVALGQEDRPRAARVAARGGLVALTALGVLLGYSHLRSLIAIPQSREWSRVLAQASRLPSGLSTVAFIAPTINRGPIKVQYGVRDEFGVPTSASTWADASLAWLAGREVGRVHGNGLRVLVTVADRGGPRPQGPYIDLGDLSRLH